MTRSVLKRAMHLEIDTALTISMRAACDPIMPGVSTIATCLLSTSITHTLMSRVSEILPTPILEPFTASPSTASAGSCLRRFVRLCAVATYMILPLMTFVNVDLPVFEGARKMKASGMSAGI